MISFSCAEIVDLLIKDNLTALAASFGILIVSMIKSAKNNTNEVGADVEANDIFMFE